jgi:hypothetical protein
MPHDVLYAVPEEQPSPPGRATVVALATLDITGTVLTAGAAAVLALNDEVDRRWWWAVGLASLSTIIATVLLIRIAERRRSFIEASSQLAADLEERLRNGMRVPTDLWELADQRRRAALASGDSAIAYRFAALLAEAPR